MLSESEFAQKIKTKYPEYAKVPDAILVQKIVEKHPEYKDQVQTSFVGRLAGATQDVSPEIAAKGEAVTQATQDLNLEATTKSDTDAPREEIGLNPSSNADVNRGGADTSFKDLPGNIIPSAVELGKSAFEMVTSPIDTVKGLGKVALGTVQKVIPGEQESEKYADAVGSFFKDRYGSLEGLKQTIINDPVGFALDISSLGGAVRGGARGVGNAITKSFAKEGIEVTPEVSKVLSRLDSIENAAGKVEAMNPVNVAGKVATSKPVTSTLKFAKDKTGEFLTALGERGFGLPDGATDVIKGAPEAFQKAWEGLTTKVSLGESIKTKIDDVLSEKSSVSQAYKPIRESKQIVKAPLAEIKDYLNKAGLRVTKTSVEELTPNASNLLPSDFAKVQEAVNLVKQAKTFTPKEGLNIRQKLDDLIDWEKPNSKANEVIKGLRGKIDTRLKDSVSGLKELDAKFADLISESRRLKKEFINKETGELKDAVLNKISSATKSGKDELLKRLEGIAPGITDDIRALNIVEQIKNPSIQSTMKNVGGSALVGAGVASIAGGGAIPLVLGALGKFYLANPETAIASLKAFAKAKGFTAEKTTQLIDQMKEVSKFSDDQLKAIEEFGSSLGDKIDAGKATFVGTLEDRASNQDTTQ